MSRIILLPRELETRLDSLAQLKEEVNGILLYRPREEYCPLEYLFMTGIGTEREVEILPERLEVINEFFRMNSDYHYVEFHTHSVGTIQTYGRKHARKLSGSDLLTIQDKLQYDSKYIHLLVTPEIKSLWGLDNPELVIVDDFSGYNQRKHVVKLALNHIARKLGYNLNEFEVITPST